MKVAMVLMHPFSESMGSVVRVRELALSLGRFGVEVYIITPYERSFDLSTKVHVVSGSSLASSLGLSKQFYRFSKSLYYSSVFPSLSSRLEPWLSAVLPKMLNGISKFMIREGIDIIQVEQDVAVPIGIGLKDETGLPLIADVHNISTEELAAVGLLEKDGENFFELQNLTAKNLSQTDHLIVVSESMKEYVVANYGLDSTFISVVPPGGRPLVGENEVEKRGKFKKVVYAGLVASREHTDLFIRSMPFVLKQDSSVQFFITNKGEALGKAKKLARDLGVAPMFFWYDDYDKVNDFLCSCDVGVLCSGNDVARQMGTPIKLFTYLSVGLPVVANEIGGWSRIIEEENIGLLTDDSPEDFAVAINRLLSDKRLRKELSFNALKAVTEKYNWRKSGESLVKVYESFS
jgi:glycosyltransferase involved in cell wall biosynthesis